jgi:hypothetical protein
MFVYAPPEGWSARRRAGITTWVSPQYPRDPATLAVFDASPRGDASIATTRALVAPTPGHDTLPLMVGALRGTLAAAPAGSLLDGVLHDGVFDYRVRLHDPKRAHAEVFHSLLESIEPVPAPRGADVAEAFSWIG